MMCMSIDDCIIRKESGLGTGKIQIIFPRIRCRDFLRTIWGQMPLIILETTYWGFSDWWNHIRTCFRSSLSMHSFFLFLLSPSVCFCFSSFRISLTLFPSCIKIRLKLRRNNPVNKTANAICQKLFKTVTADTSLNTPVELGYWQTAQRKSAGFCT